MEKVQALFIEVYEVIKGTLEILDLEYGVDGDKYAYEGF